MVFVISLYVLTVLLIGYELNRYGLTRFNKDQQGKLYFYIGFSIFCLLGIAVICASIVFDLNDGEVFAKTHKYGKQYIVTALEDPIYYWSSIAFRFLLCIWMLITGLWFATISYNRLCKRL